MKDESSNDFKENSFSLVHLVTNPTYRDMISKTDKKISQDESHLLHMIRNGGIERDRALRVIIAWSDVKAHIIRKIGDNSGQRADAEDMHAEAIVLLDRKVRRGEFKHTGSIKSYLKSTAYFLWMNRRRKEHKMQYTDDMTKLEKGQVESSSADDFKEEQLFKLFAKLGQKCQDVLKLWMTGYNHEEVADQLLISSPEMARKKKYLCMKELKALAKEAGLIAV